MHHTQFSILIDQAETSLAHAADHALFLVGTKGVAFGSAASKELSDLRQLVSARPVEVCGWSSAVHSVSYKRQRYLPEVLSYSEWLYFRFTPSLRDVEELLASAD